MTHMSNGKNKLAKYMEKTSWQNTWKKQAGKIHGKNKLAKQITSIWQKQAGKIQGKNNMKKNGKQLKMKIYLTSCQDIVYVMFCLPTLLNSMSPSLMHLIMLLHEIIKESNLIIIYMNHCSVKKRLNALSTSIDLCQPMQYGQGDTG